tara:strand:+ start:211 stop:702 length:492 start_codon:yes stop_codon:yes gene_type:complete
MNHARNHKRNSPFGGRQVEQDQVQCLLSRLFGIEPVYERTPSSEDQKPERTPADPMAALNSGPVVAIDVSDHEPLFADEAYILSFVEYPWGKIRGKTPQVPKILEALSRYTSLAGSSRDNDIKSVADVYLKPDLTQFGSLDFRSAEDIIEAGYQAGLSALDNK